MSIGLDTLKMNKLINQKLASISEVRIGKRLRGFAIAAYQHAVERVPQYSGHMASNLRISINGAPVEYTEDMFNENFREAYGGLSYQAGDKAAIDKANEKNQHVNSHYPSMYDTYTIKYAEGAQTAYFESVELATVNLRTPNMPSNAILLGEAYAVRTYGKNLSTKAELESLKI
jgi:hypothetical protein